MRLALTRFNVAGKHVRPNRSKHWALKNTITTLSGKEDVLLTRKVNQNSRKMSTAARELFYRKPLPKTCIDFASTEGKGIFTEALSDGTMNCFFKLASQFRTQDEPAYCGLSTLVMVLNALSVDPGRVWKGPWRWYHENMLDCCVPLDVTQKKGITLFHFACIATCNSLDVNMVQALPTASLTQFRDVVRNATRSDSQVLVCSYSRAILGQTGDGHFSPIGGYHAGRDLVLIFDVARFKYPPHWVQLDLLWKSMRGLDEETGQPRGYMTLSPTLRTGNPTVLFKISKNFNLTLPSDVNPSVFEMLQQWQLWLTSQCVDHLGKKEFLEILVSKFLGLWCSESFPGLDQIFTIKIDAECCGQLSDPHKCAICQIVRSLEKHLLFQMINKSFASGEQVVANCWDELVTQSLDERNCPLKDSKLPNIKLSHFATMVLLAWPYPTSNLAEKHTIITNADFCVQYLAEEMAAAEDSLKNEVVLLRSQLSTIFSYYESFNISKGDELHCGKPCKVNASPEAEQKQAV